MRGAARPRSRAGRRVGRVIPRGCGGAGTGGTGDLQPCEIGVTGPAPSKLSRTAPARLAQAAPAESARQPLRRRLRRSGSTGLRDVDHLMIQEGGAPDTLEAPNFRGEPSGIRTLDPLIKRRGPVMSRPSPLSAPLRVTPDSSTRSPPDRSRHRRTLATGADAKSSRFAGSFSAR